MVGNWYSAMASQMERYLVTTARCVAMAEMTPMPYNTLCLFVLSPVSCNTDLINCKLGRLIHHLLINLARVQTTISDRPFTAVGLYDSALSVGNIMIVRQRTTRNIWEYLMLNSKQRNTDSSLRGLNICRA